MVYKFLRGRIVGIPNKEITPEDAAELGAIIGSWYGEKSVVVTGRDYNPSSRMLKRAFVSGLMSAGVDVMDFHAAVVGEVSYSIKRFGARGGLSVASYPVIEDHIQFRIYTSPGYEVTGDGLGGIIREKKIRRSPPGETGWVTYAEYIHKLYVSAITAFINSDIVSSKGLRIAISTSYGPSDLVLPDLLANLDVDYILLSSSRKPVKGFQYPFVRDIVRVSNIVRSAKLDLGVVLNNDASALVVIDDTGRPLLPEELGLILLQMIPRGANVVVGADVFGFIDKVFDSYGVGVTRIGAAEASVMKECVKLRPAIGFNSVGEYVHPLFSLGYDAVLTLAKVLEAVASTGKTVSEIVRGQLYPRYYTIETNLPLSDAALRICGMKDTYCRQFIAGYRAIVNGQNIAIIHDPLTESTRILIDSHATGLEALVEKIHRVLASEEV